MHRVSTYMLEREEKRAGEGGREEAKKDRETAELKTLLKKFRIPVHLTSPGLVSFLINNNDLGHKALLHVISFLTYAATPTLKFIECIFKEVK